MANDDWLSARGGLQPLNQPYGQVKIGYYRLTTGAAAINVFIGMPMDLDANGRVVPATPAASNNLILGPAVGFLDVNKAALPSGMMGTNLQPYLPGNTDAWVAVADDPNQVFVIQEDTGGSALTASDVGANADWTYRSSSGSTLTGYTTAEIDRSSVGTGTGGPLVIVGLANYMNSDGTQNAPGNYGKWLVKIMSHRLGPKPGAQQI